MPVLYIERGPITVSIEPVTTRIEIEPTITHAVIELISLKTEKIPDAEKNS